MTEDGKIRGWDVEKRQGNSDVAQHLNFSSSHLLVGWKFYGKRRAFSFFAFHGNISAVDV